MGLIGSSMLMAGAPPLVIDSLTWGATEVSAPYQGTAGDMLWVQAYFHGGVSPFTVTINVAGVDRVSAAATNGSLVQGHVYAGWASGNSYVRVTDSLGQSVSSYVTLGYRTVNIYYVNANAATGGSCTSTNPPQGTFVTFTAGTPPSGHIPGDITYAWKYQPAGRGQTTFSTNGSTASTPTLNDLGAPFFNATGQTYYVQGLAQSTAFPNVGWYLTTPNSYTLVSQ